eukprot:scaffold8535_cov132-Cylindrotheca_fusiformis.AAC.6
MWKSKKPPSLFIPFRHFDIPIDKLLLLYLDCAAVWLNQWPPQKNQTNPNLQCRCSAGRRAYLSESRSQQGNKFQSAMPVLDDSHRIGENWLHEKESFELSIVKDHVHALGHGEEGSSGKKGTAGKTGHFVGSRLPFFDANFRGIVAAATLLGSRCGNRIEQPIETGQIEEWT